MCFYFKVMIYIGDKISVISLLKWLVVNLCPKDIGILQLTDRGGTVLTAALSVKNGYTMMYMCIELHC